MDADCEKCGRPYEVRDNCEPTPFCDDCAHVEIERLRDIIHRASVQFSHDGPDGQTAAKMLAVLNEADK